MSEQLNLTTFTGAHPSTGQLVEQLHAWGFRRLRVEGVHLVFRGPHGGTLRVLRSMLGRADAAVTAKAAYLVEVDEPTFWAGPEAHARDLAASDLPSQPDPGRPTDERVPDLVADPVAAAVWTNEGAAGARDPRERPSHDQIIAVVLAVHVAMDQPLGFSQVVDLAEVALSRSQVSGASSQLCRDGQLVRIRSGIYQWAQGSFTAPATPRPVPRRRVRSAAARPASPPPAAVPMPTPPAAVESAVAAAVPSPATSPPVNGQGNRPLIAELFELIFPRGVRMTAELLAEFERWAELTEKLTTYADAS